MHFSKLKQVIIFPLVAILITTTIIGISLDQNQYAYSQSPKTNTTANVAGSGVDLIDIHPSPSNVKAGSNFELLATVVNNSTGTIMLPAGRHL
jgi:hypothetical protein